MRLQANTEVVTADRQKSESDLLDEVFSVITRRRARWGFLLRSPTSGGCALDVAALQRAEIAPAHLARRGYFGG